MKFIKSCILKIELGKTRSQQLWKYKYGLDTTWEYETVHF